MEICLICKKEIEDGENTFTCTECGKVYHAKCWKTTGCCADPECREKTKLRKEAEEKERIEKVEQPKKDNEFEEKENKENKEVVYQTRKSVNLISPPQSDKIKKPIYKRKSFWVVCIVLVISIIAAAASRGNNVAVDGDVVQKIEETTSQNYEFDYDTADSVYDEIETTTEEETAEPEIQLIKNGQKITIDGICQFYVDYTKITKEVIPKNYNQRVLYSYYTADAGKTYLDICIAYKNLESTAVGADDIGNVVMYYDNNYEYTGFSIIEEESRSNFTYSSITNIDPLATEYLHYLIEVPDEIVKSGKSIVVFLRLDEESIYKINIK